ncbi:hypothetical protein OG548_14465 [Streptomyces sp. NBC_01356]|uniref:hypothetical protein n=1 Tax=Streptomyces sp. NBC_01356 TaxID=2903836 RepID=UPI002E342503|nr:hypothetical protein [Streptomyces sp. NBC_01356]
MTDDHQDGAPDPEDDRGNPDGSAASPLLDDCDLPATGARGLTIGELATMSGGMPDQAARIVAGVGISNSVGNAIGQTVASVIPHLQLMSGINTQLAAGIGPVIPHLQHISGINTQLAAGIGPVIPHLQLMSGIAPRLAAGIGRAIASIERPGIITPSLAEQWASMAMPSLSAVAQSIQFGQLSGLYQLLGDYPDLAEHLQDLDLTDDEGGTDPPADVRSDLEELARGFAQTDGTSLSWENQRRVFASAVAFAVLILMLQAMITSDVVKELVEDTATLSGVVTVVYLTVGKGWERLYPRPHADDEEEDPSPE